MTNGLDRMMEIMAAAERLKKAMQKRGLLRARAKCPFCEKGHLHGVLQGRKQHLHMRCDDEHCGVFMME